ncbi:hypothetical protein EYS14_01590 [Alteromonadaceae bacterium M269]|nr:hypothetical protein EYS14_01590 [Alteromonadaceae bacterium M269]
MSFVAQLKPNGVTLGSWLAANCSTALVCALFSEYQAFKINELLKPHSAFSDEKTDLNKEFKEKYWNWFHWPQYIALALIVIYTLGWGYAGVLIS